MPSRLQSKLICYGYADQKDHMAALEVVALLVGAGYRPTVYHNVPRPDFLLLTAAGLPDVLPTLDPFDYYPPGQLSSG